MQRAKFALPSMVTLMSIACGFGSIVISVDNAFVGDPGDYRLAAVLLLLAGVFDALDGMVARATNTQSDFGMQLDSIADVMNFGCAPGLLLYCYGFQQLGADHPTLLRLGGIASFFFVACGALRLARFNVNVGRTDPRYFVGMPITAGAACVASVVVAWPDPAASVLHALLVVLLVNLGLLAWLLTAYFVLFFAVYIAVTLALNAAWKTGWTGIAPPVVY